MPLGIHCTNLKTNTHLWEGRSAWFNLGKWILLSHSIMTTNAQNPYGTTKIKVEPSADFISLKTLDCILVRGLRGLPNFGLKITPSTNQ